MRQFRDPPGPVGAVRKAPRVFLRLVTGRLFDKFRYGWETAPTEWDQVNWVLL